MQNSSTTGGVRGRWTRALGAAVVALVLLTACSGNEGESGGLPVQAGEPDLGITGVRAPSDASGGTLRVVTAAKPDTWDPQRSYLPGIWNVMRLYIRTLVTYQAVPGKPDVLVPDLATDLGTRSPDGLTWTFTLREGIAFETGQPITSRDVKYGIERSFAARVIVGGPTYVVDLLDDKADPYAGPYEDETPGKLGLRGIATPDDRTIVFTLTSPAADFPFVLALPSSSPVPIDNDRGIDYGADPVSSGPYMITSNDPEWGVVLDRNPAWVPATDQVRTALPDRVVVRTGMLPAERDQAVLSGAADVDVSGGGITPMTTARLDGESGTGDRVDDFTSGSLRLLAVPASVVPFDNAECRAAVAALVDRRAVQDKLGGPKRAVQTSLLLPQFLSRGVDRPDVRPDLAAARDALAGCGRPDGFETVLAVSNSQPSVQVAEGIAAQLAKAGILVRVEPIDSQSFYKTVGEPATVQAKGYGLVLANWNADFPTLESFLVPLVDQSVTEQANTNFAQLSSVPVNDLVDAARVAPDPDAALEAWVGVAAAAVATHSYIPLAEARVQLIAGQRLRNAVVMQMYTSYDLATVGVQ